ncbi:murein hydrolase activator EnvC family protein [Candidatus Endowatersipora endosymbiont of Watersipora subatra]|uniref:murein hydrolase activator EnvC family protein n=1 Tax=Candidatus Endowatersipora endosymbiont of Watersipora subatra TaxID=3077946 RepID=UPI00312C70B2
MVPLVYQNLLKTRIKKTVEEKISKQHELEILNQPMTNVIQNQSQLKAERFDLLQDLLDIKRSLVENTQRSKNLEQAITKIESRLKDYQKKGITVLESLTHQRLVLTEILISLQHMGGNPLSAIWGHPKDALQVVRSTILLGTILNHIQNEIDKLLLDFRIIAVVRKHIKNEKNKLIATFQHLSENEVKLTLLIEKNQKKILQFKKKKDEQNIRASELLATVIFLEKELQNPDPENRESKRTAIERTQAFSQLKGMLPFPVIGIQLHGFGSQDQLEERAKNIALSTNIHAKVRSPADSLVAYVGPFRSYGTLLILKVGQGYYILLSGMKEIHVSKGQFILKGQTVGYMGERPFLPLSSRKIGSRRPVLYIEFRKDGKPIDPAPWWMSPKIRG